MRLLSNIFIAKTLDKFRWANIHKKKKYTLIMSIHFQQINYNLSYNFKNKFHRIISKTNPQIILFPLQDVGEGSFFYPKDQ